MVLFFSSSAVEPPAVVYMGRDKVENEDLLRHADSGDIWFHADKFSSAHVYLRLPPNTTWESIPGKLLDDLSQLVKANSIEGNKRDNITIIYTPWRNVKKTGDMAIGSVMFHNDQKVKRHFVARRENAVVNRLNKTKQERQVDYAAQRIERERAKGKLRRQAAEEAKQQEEAERQRKLEEKTARDYSSIFSSEAMETERRERDRRARAKAQERAERGEPTGGQDEDDDSDNDGGHSDDSFM